MNKITPIVKKLLENNPVAFATADKNGKPNVISVAFVKAVSSTQIIITDNYMKQTKTNILYNNNICLAFWNSKWQGYKIIGKAKYYDKGKWKKLVETMPENKGLSAKGAILIKISKIIKLG